MKFPNRLHLYCGKVSYYLYFVVMTIAFLDVIDASMKRKVDELRAAVSNWMEDERNGCSRRFFAAVST